QSCASRCRNGYRSAVDDRGVLIGQRCLAPGGGTTAIGNATAIWPARVVGDTTTAGDASAVGDATAAGDTTAVGDTTAIAGADGVPSRRQREQALPARPRRQAVDDER